MNMMSSTAQFTTVPVEAVDIPAVTEIYIELNRIMGQPMPDDVMSALGDALAVTLNTILEAPIFASRDIGAKLRFAALLVEDDVNGCYWEEAEAVRRCVEDLETFRAAQWAEVRAGLHVGS